MPDPGRDVPLQNIAAALSKLASGGALLINVQTYSTFTWTPALAFGGGSTGITYSNQTGIGTRIGREFFLKFTVGITSKGSSTGAASIAGLPVPSGSDSVGAGGLLTNYSGMLSLASAPILSVPTAASGTFLYQGGATGVVALNNGNFTSVSSISGEFSYSV